MEQQERKSAMPELERFIRSMGMTEGQAMQLMTGAVKHQAQMMQRARQVIAAMEAIDDEKFTPEALRANPEAMRAMEQGASVGQVYRMYFLGGMKMPVQETEANLGLGGWMGDGLTPEQIEKISAYVSKTGQTYEMD